MPRVNRKIRVRRQNPATRAQILELLLGPYGDTVFPSESEKQRLWEELQAKYSPGFAAQWYAVTGRRRPFVEIATQYARQVIAGEIEACRWTKLACERHFKDLERGQFLFDEAKAERACRFLEMLPHVKGNWAARSELMVLRPWQVFLVCMLFGWVKTDGLRRFTLAYIKVPRKNGKSFLAAGIGLYLFACDMEFGSEVYSGATTEKQAFEVFRPAVQMIERSQELAQALGVVAGAKGIKRPEDGSRFEVVIGKPGDGASVHGALVDEYHEHDTDALLDTLRTGMGARSQPLGFIITTAGDNTAGPCQLLEGDCCMILQGSVVQDDVFVLIYGIDDPKKWTDPSAMAMANPNLGVSVSREYLIAQQQEAILKPRKQGVYQAKYLNIWVGAVASYFDIRSWGAQANPKLRRQDLAGTMTSVVAMDLATKRDFTARITLFHKRQSGKDHYYLFPRFYLPQAQIDRPDAPHYKEWAAAGWIQVHEGSTVDFEKITQEAIAEVREMRAAEFVFDPWNPGVVVAQAVEKATKALQVEIPQAVKHMNLPMKELDEAIADGRVHHDGNPVLEWMIGNVTAKEDANENVFPRKEPGREDKKIDGAVAAIMGIARARFAKPDAIQYRGLRSVAC